MGFFVKRALWAGLVAGLGLMPMTAGAVVLDCSLQPGADAMGWISKRVVIDYDEAAGTARAADEAIQGWNGGPIEAKVRKPSANQVSFTWDLTIPDAVQAARLQFRLTWLKADNGAVMAVKPLGYSNNFDARGSCKVK
ncbi:hypothetical protein [Stagnihabitans tardus]|uniref:Uncharacterized protein n=1 Tax=Stagnihabitans tardus TaxID=2699202 RepID=A0AAE4YCT4_9RHOB|nr:hypothetical protein [Stagnihabitans tardus]NBZ87595.1 hypothetical protein [Stagnihabitans tardus]